MAWVCPKCHRRFKNPHQSHSCVQIKHEDHFVDKPLLVKKTYEKLIKAIHSGR